MKTLRLLTLMTTCCAIGTMTTTAWAAEPAPAKQATPAPATPAAESAAPKADEQSTTTQSSSTGQSPSTAKGTQDDEEAEAAPPPVAKPRAAGKGGSPERFVPSEQVRADFDVSFPIDI